MKTLICALLLLLAAVLFATRCTVGPGPDVSSISCMNHALQLASIVYDYCDKYGTFPQVDDAREAFVQMARATAHPERIELLSGGGAACPQCFADDGSLGYLYFASGLPTSLLDHRELVVFACPASSHIGIQDSQALTRGVVTKFKNKKMIELLQRAVASGTAREIPYSESAIELMKREIARREARSP